MTRGEDVEAAARLGVDAIGLVFYPRSPRYVNIAQAQALVARLPAFVTVTGLFLDPTREEVLSILDVVRVDLLQFHGSEPPEFCRNFNRRYIKAVPMGSQVDIEEYARRYSDAAALLLDSHAAGQTGGTGITFEWSRVKGFKGPPLILAGGLKPGNVAAAIGSIHPYGVDVSSGVERAPGIKDVQSMSEFITEVNSVSNL
jgi:phosphoribosylanthranilate isomerase